MSLIDCKRTVVHERMFLGGRDGVEQHVCAFGLGTLLRGLEDIQKVSEPVYSAVPIGDMCGIGWRGECIPTVWCHL
jgi:hypothetical protein